MHDNKNYIWPFIFPTIANLAKLCISVEIQIQRRNERRGSKKPRNDVRDKSVSINLPQWTRAYPFLFISIGRHRPFTRYNYVARWSIVETRPMKTLCTMDDPQLRVPPGFLLFIFSPPTALPLHLRGFAPTRCHAASLLPIRGRPKVAVASTSR